MIEQEAWNQCAVWWDAAQDEGVPGQYEYYKSYNFTTGICGCVGWLFSLGRIDGYTYKTMLGKIDALPGLTRGQFQPIWGLCANSDAPSGFKFPCTAEGAKQRAAWCRKMAEECGK